MTDKTEIKPRSLRDSLYIIRTIFNNETYLCFGNGMAPLIHAKNLTKKRVNDFYDNDYPIEKKLLKRLKFIKDVLYSSWISHPHSSLVCLNVKDKTRKQTLAYAEKAVQQIYERKIK